MQSNYAVIVRGLSVSYPKNRGLQGFLAQDDLCRKLLTKEQLGEVQVLHDLDVEIPAGKIFGLVGINGAGKSTLVDTIVGLIAPKAGTITIHGLPAGSAEARQIVSKCGRELHKEFTALQHIEFSARIYGLDVDKAKAAGTKLLIALGMSEADCSKPAEALSTGNKAKARVVRSLIPILGSVGLNDGMVLLLDEPTLGMDVKGRRMFFAALKALQEAIPALTIVVATNEPQEAALCDDYMAIVNGTGRHDAEQFAVLKTKQRFAGDAIIAMQKMISPNGAHEESQPFSVVDLQDLRIPKVSTAFMTPVLALWWRALLDWRQNQALTIMVVLSLVMPNLIGQFAALDRPVMGYVLGMCGVLASLVVREAFRFLERERSYFCMLELIVLSPINRMQHTLGHLGAMLLVQCFFACSVSVVMGLLQFGFGFPAALAPNGLTAVDACGMIAIVGCVILASYAVGITSSLIPFVTKGENAFFISTLFPMLFVAASGLYSDPSLLPTGFSQFAYANPLSYAPHAVSEFLHLNLKDPPRIMPLALLLQQFLPGIASSWAHVMVMVLMSSVYSVAAFGIYGWTEPLLRKAGRFRNIIY